MVPVDDARTAIARRQLELLKCGEEPVADHGAGLA
jgi:hypothetical protein